MNLYDFKAYILCLIYKTCPYSGEKLTVSNFLNGYFDIDHISSSRRGSKISKDEYNALNSLINLRPYKHSMHLNTEKDLNEYIDSSRWFYKDWTLLKDELIFNKIKYTPLFLNDSYETSELIQLSFELFESTNVKIPDWYFLTKYISERK